MYFFFSPCLFGLPWVGVPLFSTSDYCFLPSQLLVHIPLQITLCCTYHSTTHIKKYLNIYNYISMMIFNSHIWDLFKMNLIFLRVFYPCELFWSRGTYFFLSSKNYVQYLATTKKNESQIRVLFQSRESKKSLWILYFVVCYLA